MGSIQTAQAIAGFIRDGTARGRCANCQHAADLEGLRCQIGGFWVRKNDGCNKFSDRLPMAARVEGHALPAPQRSMP